MKSLIPSSCVVAALVASLAASASAREHTADYTPGYQEASFVSTGQMSDGSYPFCAGSACRAAHRVYFVRAGERVYAIEAPVSQGRTAVLSLMTNGVAPRVHQEWFMDELRQGDRVRVVSRCDGTNRCTFSLPNPEKAGRVYATAGYFIPDNSETAEALCEGRKLPAAVEAEVCTAHDGVAAPQLATAPAVAVAAQQ